jgi:phosphorylcholine metabolism protein LicD
MAIKTVGSSKPRNISESRILIQIIILGGCPNHPFSQKSDLRESAEIFFIIKSEG